MRQHTVQHMDSEGKSDEGNLLHRSKETQKVNLYLEPDLIFKSSPTAMPFPKQAAIQTVPDLPP